jgi:hypothetical protein
MPLLNSKPRLPYPFVPALNAATQSSTYVLREHSMLDQGTPQWTGGTPARLLGENHRSRVVGLWVNDLWGVGL